MKTQLTNSQNNYISTTQLAAKHKKFEQQGLKEQNTREKNTEIRPARAISFGGSNNSLKIGNTGRKILGALIENNNKASKVTNGLINAVNENEAAFNAVYSLVLAGMIKPALVLHMPGSEEKDKQIVATKNFVQAFIGSFLSFTIGGGFIKKAIDVIKNNLKLIDKIDDNGNITVLKATSEKALDLAQKALVKENSSLIKKIKTAAKSTADTQGFDKAKTFFKTIKTKEKYIPSIDEIAKKADDMVGNFNKGHLKIFERNKDFLKELKNNVKNTKSGTAYSDAFETLWKNSTGALTSIGKAKISSIILPAVTAALFAKKNLEKEMAKKEQERQNKIKETTLTNNTSFKNQQAQFKQMMNKNNPQIAFSGKHLNAGIDVLAKGVEYVGMSKPGASLTRLLAKAKKPSARMGDIESFAITAYWLQNTARNKKIEPSQKLGLNVHTLLVTLVSSTAAFIIDAALDKVNDIAEFLHKEKITDIVDTIKQNDSLLNVPELDCIKDFPKSVQSLIKKACLNIIDSKDQSSDVISNALNSLKKTNEIKDAIQNGATIDENLLQNTIETLKKSEALSNAIKEKCGNMIDAKNISKKLSRIDLRNNDAVTKTIEDLSKDYKGKLKKFKSIMIFTLVVRLLVPVLMVPISGKLKRKIVEWREGKTQKA